MQDALSQVDDSADLEGMAIVMAVKGVMVQEGMAMVQDVKAVLEGQAVLVQDNPMQAHQEIMVREGITVQGQHRAGIKYFIYLLFLFLLILEK